MDELLAQFLIEAPELVQRATDDLIALEAAPQDRARLDGAFRAIHTLKGSVALFDMAPLGQALHVAEDWLGGVRAGREALDRHRVGATLDLLGASAAWFGDFAAAGALPAAAQAACRRISHRLGGSAGAAETQEMAAGETPPWADSFLRKHIDKLPDHGPRLLIRYAPDADCYFRGEDPLALIARTPGLIVLDIEPREPWPAPEAYTPYRCNLVVTALAAVALTEARAHLRAGGRDVTFHEPPPAAAAAAVPDGAASARALRVEPGRIDALLGLASELVTVNAAIGGVVAGDAPPRELAAHHRQLDRLTGELHAAAMRLRLAPLSRTFERLPRLARDLGERLGKPVTLKLEGGAVEADRTVVDALFEPLLHLIRNALDHGVETAAQRQAAGKPAQAVVGVSARAEAGELRIEVSDDGRGVDLQAVRSRAVARGLLTPDKAAALDEAGVLDLLFASGFSTAAVVSDVSGRGVGLDVVRETLEALGGGVGLASTAGQGTRALLRAPIAATLNRMLLIEVGGETYGAPLAAIAQVARLPTRSLKSAAGGETIDWRGRVTPVVWLHDRLQLPRPALGQELSLILARSSSGATAFVVDRFIGRAGGVLRPPPPLLRSHRGLLGATLDPAGGVVFVLNLSELAA